MKIRSILSLGLVLILISIILNASDQEIQDSLTTKDQDSTTIAQAAAQEKKDIETSKGIQIDLSKILAAIIGGLFTLLATYLGIKLKLRFDEKKKARK